MNRAEQILNHVRGPAVLDVGCADHVLRPQSPYWVHAHLRRSFADVWGIDLDNRKIEAMKHLGYQNVQVANAEDFALAVKFDTIVAGELIEHLSNPGRFLNCARLHLRGSGRLVLTTPNPFGLFNIVYAWTKNPKTCSNPEHTAWFCPTTLEQLVGRHGFLVEKRLLIQDYEEDNPSARYRLFVRLMKVVGPIFPGLIRCNGSLYVLAPH